MKTLPDDFPIRDAADVTGEDFCDCMEKIWADWVEPTADGGTRIYGSKWYNEWSNANVVIRLLGGKQTGSGKGWPGKNTSYQVYELPNGDRVKIGPRGGACAMVTANATRGLRSARSHL